MRTLVAVGAVVLTLAGAAQAAAPSTAELMATPRAFMAALGAGKIDAAAQTMTEDATIVDEFAPFAWGGPDAFHHWLADYAAFLKAGHVTDSKVRLDDPIQVMADGDHGYVVAASSEAYKESGKRMAESARMVFALRREGGVWKIASWAWAARPPHEVGAGAAKKPM